MHGGDIYNNIVDIDFSVSLNPYKTQKMSALIDEAVQEGLSYAGRYPDIEQRAVRSALAGANNVSPDCVIAGNGSSELILAAVRAVLPKTALLIEPCYGGYRYALESTGCRIREYHLKKEDGFTLTEEIMDSITDDIDMLFLCDPWNPTGQNIDEHLLDRILVRADELGIAVVLDRSFYMLSDMYLKYTNENVADLTGRFKKLFITVSYTKCLALPGIRTGYVIGSENAVRSIHRALPEWNMSCVSSALLSKIESSGSSQEFFSESVKMISEERKFLAGELSRCGLFVFESDANYILCYGQKDIYEKLLSMGILIRRCDDLRGLQEGYYRIAVRSHEDNMRLIDAIGSGCQT